VTVSGDTLTRSKDRKVTNAVSPNGKTPVIANSFGLPAGRDFSCPGATPFCERICYAGKLEKVYKGVRNVLTRNYDALRNATRDEIALMLSTMIKEFRAECDKRGAVKAFRIHWDGDFFSNDYTRAWADVIAYNPDIQFWVYTRVFSSAVILSEKNFANLGLYFSADRDNIAIARVAEMRGINIAYVDTTFAEGKAEFPKASLCPENNRAIALISEKGSACIRCGLCVNGRKSVLFSTTKR
jgi:Gene product 88